MQAGGTVTIDHMSEEDMLHSNAQSMVENCCSYH
jgi:hypothetical protein